MIHRTRSAPDRRWATVGLVVAVAWIGCASATTRFERRHADPGELVWAYDNDLKLYKGGQLVCGSDWKGLAEATSGVPQAESKARAAREHHVLGRLLQILGAGVIVAGTTTAFVTAPADLGESRSALSEPSVWIGVGSFSGGLSLAIYGLRMQGVAPKEAIDAVNIYNSHRVSGRD